MKNTTGTALDLEAIVAATGAATNGPWYITGDKPGGKRVGTHAFHGTIALMASGDNEELDGEFIAAARTWVPQLVAEVIKLRTAVAISLRSNVMCRHRLATTADEVAEHLKDCTPANAAIVAHEGDADEPVTTMIAQGWRLGEHVEYLAGKRIRTLTGPDTGTYAVVDDPGQEITRLRAQIAAALDACDQMMAGTLSPPDMVAKVREALGYKLPSADVDGAQR